MIIPYPDARVVPCDWSTPEWWQRYDWMNGQYRTEAEIIAFTLGMDDALIQAIPNLRIHPPGGKSVPWHTDSDFGHLPEEWNVWVPLTYMEDDSQRLWVKDETGTYPVDVPVGCAFVFRGATTLHGCIRNRTDTARYSFDFRLLRKADYRDEGRVTVKYGVPLRLGDYWREL